MSARSNIVRVGYRLRQFLMFAVVGLVATAMQYGILVVGVEIFALPPTAASGIGFAVSATANYLLNYRLTFRSSIAHASAAMRFIVVASVGLLLNVATMELLSVHWHFQYVLAQLVTTALILMWTFSGSAFWTFADRANR